MVENDPVMVWKRGMSSIKTDTEAGVQLAGKNVLVVLKWFEHLGKMREIEKLCSEDVEKDGKMELRSSRCKRSCGAAAESRDRIRNVTELRKALKACYSWALVVLVLYVVDVDGDKSKRQEVKDLDLNNNKSRYK